VQRSPRRTRPVSDPPRPRCEPRRGDVRLFGPDDRSCRGHMLSRACAIPALRPKLLGQGNCLSGNAFAPLSRCPTGVNMVGMATQRYANRGGLARRLQVGRTNPTKESSMISARRTACISVRTDDAGHQRFKAARCASISAIASSIETTCPFATSAFASSTIVACKLRSAFPLVVRKLVAHVRYHVGFAGTPLSIWS
jgi:hypothetical protein